MHRPLHVEDLAREDVGASPAIERTVLRFEASDGFVLHADLHTPEAPSRAVLLAPAMAVHRGFYGRFAAHLAGAGIAVLVPDYRGSGDSRPTSLKGFSARLHEWGELDLQAALDLLADRFATLPRAFIGHSIGGQLFGLVERPQVSRALLVASGSGYVGLYDWPRRATLLALYHGLMPLVNRALGYVPMTPLTRNGESIGPEVARDWMRWATHPSHVIDYARTKRRCAFTSFRGPLRVYGFADDPFAPRRAVERLASYYEHASAEQHHLHPRDLRLRAIGHFEPFRPAVGPALWDELTRYLCEDDAPPARGKLDAHSSAPRSRLSSRTLA